MAILVAALVQGNATGADFIVQDGTFQDVDWSSSILLDTTPGANASFARTQVLTGGNPGAYQRTTLTWMATGGTSQGVFVAQHRNGATYSPSSGGAITSINFSFDDILLSQSGGPEPFQALLLVQDGTYYAHYTTSTNSPTWASNSEPGLLASDFSLLSGPGPALPSFLASGQAIQFGYITSSAAQNAGTFSIISGVDNYSLTVHTSAVPEPSSLMLGCIAGAGMWLVTAWRRRAR
jgi:hypothetical protein